MNRLPRAALIVVTAIVSASVWAADAPMPSEFAWRATLVLPAAANMARVTLPPDAMVHLQSSDARDIRVFNADGEAVPFALTAPDKGAPSPAPTQTRSYPAFPLFAAARDQRPAQGSVQVHLDQSSSQNSVWVRFGNPGDKDGAAIPSDPAVTRLQAALFDTREEKQTITAITLQADLPTNALVNFSIATSTDLAQWTPVTVRGPVFRFEGTGAPMNYTLELAQALPLEGRYLRLNWEGQTGVLVNGFTGRVVQARTPPPRVRAPLPPAILDGPTGMNWPLAFATPLAGLHISSLRSNTLLPLRIMGRNDTTQPWRQLATAVVYHLDAAGMETNNPPVELGGVSVRWLRVEASNGMALSAMDLQATLEFEPVQVVFLASGRAPFELAVGRAGTPAAAMNRSLLSSVVTGKLEDLPSAGFGRIQLAQDTVSYAAVKRFLPAGFEERSLVLWFILVAGVLVLAAVTYALFRQLSAKPAQESEVIDASQTQPKV